MLTEDYIMRLINQALAVLLAALGLKKAGKYKEALQTFDQSLETLLGLNARLVEQLDDGMLLDRLTFMGKLDLDRVLVLADIFREEAEVYKILGQTDQGLFAATRSLRLYLEVILVSDVTADRELIEKIEALRHKTPIIGLPIETRLALQDYLDRLLALNDDALGTAGLARADLLADLSALDNLNMH